MYYSNQDYIDKKIKNYEFNCPYNIVREELQSSYDEAIEDYFRKQNITDIRVILSYRLGKKIDELSKVYSDDSIIDSALNMKRRIILNKIQNEEIVNEIIDNLTEFYLINKMNNKKTFELFIIDAVENFDMEEYLELKVIKEQINLKVLRRPKIK